MTALKFPARFDYLDDIREYVGQVSYSAGFADKEVYSIQLATDEAVSNVIEHAYKGLTDGSLELTCEFENNKLIITILDHGKSFDLTKVVPPDLKADLSRRKIGGLGIYLMRKLMDDVRYEVTAAGNLLTLIKMKE
jgi:anti-sigma regulatory factor (Ser/Thr protein kinase)